MMSPRERLQNENNSRGRTLKRVHLQDRGRLQEESEEQTVWNLKD
jgi:hypothetical protein